MNIAMIAQMPLDIRSIVMIALTGFRSGVGLITFSSILELWKPVAPS